MKKKKTAYRVRNWKEYNRSLKMRGSLTFWMSGEIIERWLLAEGTGERGRAAKYSSVAIETMLAMKIVFRQAGRQTCGLVESIFELMKVDLPVPDHSTISRRMAGLEVTLPVKPSGEPRHIVCDSTGVKVYGEGEWKVRQHGFSKYRTWRKLHLHVDEKTHEVVAAGASENSVSDAEIFPEMLAANEEEIGQISGDGAYDKKKVYQAIEQRGIKKAAIPPRQNAKIWKHGNAKGERHIRDENLRHIRKKGREKWKQDCNYHRRSIAETAVFRFKTIFSDKLQSRNLENQFQEMLIKCTTLNRMTLLGMPDTHKVTL